MSPPCICCNADMEDENCSNPERLNQGNRVSVSSGYIPPIGLLLVENFWKQKKYFHVKTLNYEIIII